MTRLGFAGLLSCFTLSGLAGLIYQTAWARQFALVFGTTELALVTVLAAYMAGLALGSAVAGRHAHRFTRIILIYALLELGIAVSAILVADGIDLIGRLQVALFGSSEFPNPAPAGLVGLFYLVASFLIVLVPTTLMGATLPLLARWAVRREAQIGSRVGLLYFANTAGAAGGALLAGFVLLPWLGLSQTVWVGIGVNALVFLLAVMLSRGAAAQSVRQGLVPSRRLSNGWMLWLVLISGMVSFTWEVLWARLLSPLLGGTVYAYATMLGTFLVGLALGSLLAGRAASSAARSIQGFVLAQLGIAGLFAGSFWAIQLVPALTSGWAADSRLAGAALCAVTLLPGALAVGATFPLAVRAMVDNPGEAGAASGRVFAWNTVGAIAGALLAGYLLLPSLGFAGTATAALATSLALAGAAGLAMNRNRPALLTAVAACLVALAVLPPGNPWSVLKYAPLRGEQFPGEVRYLGVGRSATVLLTETPRDWRLSSNGLPESSIEPAWGRPGRYVVARWLSQLPLQVRPESRSLLVVGLGAGVTVEDVPPSVDEIHVVEIEPEVVAANRSVSDVRWRDPLADPRLQLQINDARGALRMTSRRFDVVVSQPSHPWTSGASHLFTREFYDQVRTSLTADGVFALWMGINFVDEPLFRSMLRTMNDVFAYVEVYQPLPGAVVMISSEQPVELDAARPELVNSAAWGQVGIDRLEQIQALRILDAEGSRSLSRDGQINTDQRNLFQFSAPGSLQLPMTPDVLADLLAPYPPNVMPGGSAQVDLARIRFLLRCGMLPRSRRIAEGIADAATREAALGLVQLAARQYRRAAAGLRRAVALDPDGGEAHAALMTLHQSELARGLPGPIPQVHADEFRSLVIDGWRFEQAGDWRSVQDLDQRLGGISSDSPLYPAAVRLRSHWRTESGQRAAGEEAMDLLLPLLAPRPGMLDLLLYARAARVAGHLHASRTALFEAQGLLQAMPAGHKPGQRVQTLLRLLRTELGLDLAAR
ncbi:MAG: fused MFS/spermidine synthase [Xanthomonadales bacterium]|nr:fused MFS/spermidine synthase [Xanthomonadales bacterium]